MNKLTKVRTAKVARIAELERELREYNRAVKRCFRDDIADSWPKLRLEICYPGFENAVSGSLDRFGIGYRLAATPLTDLHDRWGEMVPRRDASRLPQ